MEADVFGKAPEEADSGAPEEELDDSGAGAGTDAGAAEAVDLGLGAPFGLDFAAGIGAEGLKVGLPPPFLTTVKAPLVDSASEGNSSSAPQPSKDA